MAPGLLEEDLDPALDPRQVIRINYEKCTVELRSRRLVQYVNETLGETTGYVYGQLLAENENKSGHHGRHHPGQPPGQPPSTRLTGTCYEYDGCMTFDSVPWVVTMKKNEHYFPTTELIKDPSEPLTGWRRITYEGGKKIEGEGHEGSEAEYKLALSFWIALRMRTWGAIAERSDDARKGQPRSASLNTTITPIAERQELFTSVPSAPSARHACWRCCSL
ncbi:RNA polymerase III subunit RPC82-domain-containing protein [Neurospora tetraspora]|uniref:RNA polymerase III subunit RPC82-domain-containing protein n=1 Tax=Neurospora tetraspora TaxID=94610 RepID=A0AAE0MPC5_9PEZI|nr:RNA polymerase III subunit RPC82-domain-containing protein [Neurospora tetraspora]